MVLYILTFTFLESSGRTDSPFLVHFLTLPYHQLINFPGSILPSAFPTVFYTNFLSVHCVLHSLHSYIVLFWHDN
jgi:hypothetical protein